MLSSGNDTVDNDRILSPWLETLARIGPAIIVALFYVTVVLHYSYTPDHTYIYLQYARNLATGNGFAFDANSPSYGVAGPLWVLLIAGGAKAGLDPFVVAKTFDLLFASLSIVLVFTFSLTLLQDKIYALFAALIFSFDAWFLHWSGSGTETSFAIILVLLTVKYAYLEDYHIAGFVAGLLTLVRPEGALLFLVVQLENYFVSYVLRRKKRMFWIPFLVYGLVLAPWLLYSLVTFGSIVPDIGLAARVSEWSLGAVATTAWDSARTLGSTQLVTVLLLLVGIPLVVRKMGIGTLIVKGMPVLWVIILLIGYAILSVQVVPRYLLMVVPLIVVYGLWTLKQLDISFRWSFRKSLVVLSTVAFVTILQNEIIYRLTVVPTMDEDAIAMERGMKPIALWLRTNSDQDATILTSNIGLVGYVADRKTYNTLNRVTPQVNEALRGGEQDRGVEPPLYGRLDRPDFVVDRAGMKDRLASTSLKPVLTTEIASPGTTTPDTIFYTLYRVLQ